MTHMDNFLAASTYVTLVPYLRWDVQDLRMLWPLSDSLVQDCSNSIANALELLQFCTK